MVENIRADEASTLTLVQFDLRWRRRQRFSNGFTAALLRNLRLRSESCDTRAQIWLSRPYKSLVLGSLLAVQGLIHIQGVAPGLRQTHFALAFAQFAGAAIRIKVQRLFMMFHLPHRLQ